MQVFETKTGHNTVCEYIPFQTSMNMNGSTHVMYNIPLNSDAFASNAKEIPHQVIPRTTIIEVKL